MILEKALSKATIKLDIGDMDKWSAIESLTDLIVETGKVTDPEGVWHAVLDRERKHSTGLANGIALPHARCDFVDDIVIALGISKKGIDFDSVDGRPCHVIFLVLAPQKNESTRYLKVLAEAASFGSDTGAVAALKGATTPEKALSILCEYCPKSVH